MGSRSQRGLTQLALDVLFHSIGPNMLDRASLPSVLESLQACDPSESALSTASHFLDSTYADPSGSSRANSRAPTPMIVRPPQVLSPANLPGRASWLPASQSQIPCTYPVSASASPKSVRLVSETEQNLRLKQR